MKVDWGKFGKYELRADGGNPKSLVGAVAGSSNPDDWRKANFVRAFTPQEALLSGSAWQLHFEGGSPFRVEFHADGHFNAPAYPAHSWYKLDGDAVFVEWGKYGQYEFVLDVAKREMNGHLRGNEKSWRRLEYTEPMAAYGKHTAATTTGGARGRVELIRGVEKFHAACSQRVLLACVQIHGDVRNRERLLSVRSTRPVLLRRVRVRLRDGAAPAAVRVAVRRRLQNGRRPHERTGRCGRRWPRDGRVGRLRR